jgi:hypothetical protein
MFGSYRDSIQAELIPDLAAKKCARKNIVFRNFEDIFAENLMKDLDAAWEQWVGPLMVELPAKQLVINELKEFFNEVLKS